VKIVLAFLGSFITFFPAGYAAADYFMSTPEYLSIYVASHTMVKLEDGVLYMRFTDEQGDPFWKYNLSVNKGQFENGVIKPDTLIDAELEAASPLVMAIISGGSGVTMLTTARGILKQVILNEPGDREVKIASAAGMVSGGLVGYWVKNSLVGPDIKKFANL